MMRVRRTRGSRPEQPERPDFTCRRPYPSDSVATKTDLSPRFGTGPVPYTIDWLCMAAGFGPAAMCSRCFLATNTSNMEITPCP